MEALMVKERINGKALRGLPGFKIGARQYLERSEGAPEYISYNAWCIVCYSDLTKSQQDLIIALDGHCHVQEH
jgi:hypothetical protein